MIVNIFLSRHGSGSPALLLLHGLGATSEVWDGLLRSLGDRWPGEVLVPDLPGHGRSAPLARYSFGGMAAALAAALDPRRPVAVLGHSLGGVVGLVLASGWFGLRVPAVCGLGVKVRWSADELAKAASLAERPAQVLATREEAEERALRVAGLHGLVTSTDAGVKQVDDGWSLTLDGKAFGVGEPDVPGLLAACRGEVVLAAGELDPMSPAEHLADLGEPTILAGLGHNAHVERPEALWPLIDRLRAGCRSVTDVDDEPRG
ncbi:alpha/beta fold hydrolase [Actinophytocola xanthii]|uniref:Alpha/beta hydrolase n=1 Tax=Actinophytocola xanthii TaxID=1912961 RepID=A0A1Q8C1L6_9PSEU|nr:alpha/beta hydrolase [Actinophytocola xanthii]OLF08253.1 alpha/beta hydrolase [Actinophytocola xanthii]